MKIQNHHDDSGGFSLLELLFSIMFLGVLVGITLPSLIGQAGKARTAEARQILGSINRAQQAYNFEYGTFATDIVNLSTVISGGALRNDTWETKAYIYSIQTGATANEVHHLAQPLGTYANDTKQLTSAVYQINTGVVTGLCQAYEVYTTPEMTAFNICLRGEILQ